MTATYRLKQAGHVATLYEASDRVGGRCWSIRGAFADGQVAEHGGELIDQGHTAIRQLAQELGLKLDNLLSSEVNGTEPFYFFDGQLPDALRRDLDAARPRARSDVDPTTSSAATTRSPTAWRRASAPGRSSAATSLSRSARTPTGRTR